MALHKTKTIIYKSKHTAKHEQDKVNGWKSSHHNVSRIQGNNIREQYSTQQTLPSGHHHKPKSQMKQWQEDSNLLPFIYISDPQQRQKEERSSGHQGGFFLHSTDKVFPFLPHTWEHRFVFAREPSPYSEPQTATTNTRYAQGHAQENIFSFWRERWKNVVAVV